MAWSNLEDRVVKDSLLYNLIKCCLFVQFLAFDFEFTNAPLEHTPVNSQAQNWTIFKPSCPKDLDINSPNLL